MSGMTDKAWQCDLLADCLDDWGFPTEAANVRGGEDLESYESDFRLMQKLSDYGLLDTARLREQKGEAVAHVLRIDTPQSALIGLYDDTLKAGDQLYTQRAPITPAPIARVGDAVPQMFILGREYATRGGATDKLVSIHNAGTDYETMACANGVHRYTRRLHPLNFGRVTGTDGTDPRDLIAPHLALSSTAAPAVGDPIDADSDADYLRKLGERIGGNCFHVLNGIAAAIETAAPESLREWSLRMAKGEARQNVSAGSHGIADEPAAPAPVSDSEWMAHPQTIEAKRQWNTVADILRAGRDDPDSVIAAAEVAARALHGVERLRLSAPAPVAGMTNEGDSP